MAKSGDLAKGKKISGFGKKATLSGSARTLKVKGVTMKDFIGEEFRMPIMPEGAVVGHISAGKGTATKAVKVVRRTGGFNIESLKIQSRNPLEMAEKVSKGLETSRVNFLAIALGLTGDEVITAMDIKPRTWARRKTEGLLSKAESERLVRIGMLVDQAKQVFEGDVEATHRWLSQPSRALGGKPPLDVASTELGASEVRDLLVRLEHGVPS